MNIVTKDITIQQEILTLTNQRALFWEREKTLVVSDLHIGKTAHFRKAGIAIPSAILDNDLNRLKKLIHHFNAAIVLIVGDLFHAEVNHDIHLFEVWKMQLPSVRFELIKGNHDKLKECVYDTLNIFIYKEFKEKLPFRFVHDANHCQEPVFCISGHTHPGVVMNGRGKVRIKLPCFQKSATKLILPAFSEFTGLNTNQQEEESICFAFTDTDLFEV